jgi:HlyD family secretion protein
MRKYIRVLSFVLTILVVTTTYTQAQVNTAQANLDQIKASAPQSDIDSAKAQILSAQGQVDAAQANYDNTVLRAPATGTITQVDIKVGEQASTMQEVMILQDIGDLHAEANVSEANIASIQAGQSVDYTFDALGTDQHFSGQVESVNPASIVIAGVVDYKVTANFNNVPGIKPGMTANMTILVAKKDNALAVPSSAVIQQNNQQIVRVIDDLKKQTYHNVVVQTGLQADGGLTEITSGLSEGQTVITYMK